MSKKAFNINPKFSAKKKEEKNALYYIEGIY
jgi:hypothetical protein